MKTSVSFDRCKITNLNTIIETYVPLSFDLISLNRVMVIPDTYAFVISSTIV
ncbi:hypothetical protein [Polaribacter sp.]|uniref:hypothetical protein n=1 Tax=Polaribacter sp. TaxID=1920175 RepID=UPI003F4B805D